MTRTDVIATYLRPRSDGGAGLTLIPIQRGGKQPFDPRTYDDRSEDDAAGWAPAWGAATTSLNRWESYEAFAASAVVDDADPTSTDLPPMNVAADVGLSRAIVIDADTEAEVAAFRSWAQRVSGDSSWATAPLTVSTPGVVGDGGEWKHKGGGHMWFFLPEGYEMPAELPGTLTVRDGGTSFAIFLRDHYVLIPPSVRPEGPYVFTGAAPEAPAWLLAQLDNEAARRAEARVRARLAREQVGEGGLSDDLRADLQAWYEATPWAELLTPIGWAESGRDGSCGCPVWRRPGGASWKSATTHQPGCSDYRYADSDDPPVHFWTTEPGPAIEAKLAEVGSEGTMSKLHLFAALYHDGNDASALSAAVGRELNMSYAFHFVEVHPGLAVWAECRPVAAGEASVTITPYNAVASAAATPATDLTTATSPALPAPTAALVAPAVHPAAAGAPAQQVLSIDLETYSPQDLGQRGVYEYAADPSFEILLCAYSWNGGNVQLVDLTAGEPLPQDVLDALTDDTVIKSAYNAAFERVCLSRHLHDLGKLPEGTYLDPAGWQCSMIHAAVANLPEGLGEVAAALGLVEKLEEGKDLIKYFCTPNKPAKSTDLTHTVPTDRGKVRWLPESDPAAWAAFRLYCVRDVEVEIALRAALAEVPAGSQLWREYAADQRINDLGIHLDLDYAAAAVEIDKTARDTARARLCELTGLDNPRSVQQIKGWLEQQGYQSETVDKAAMASVAAQARKAGDLVVAEVCDLRPAITAAAASKFSTMQVVASADDRARGQLRFMGTHTGRWAGRRLQPQNMTHTPHVADLDAAREAVFRGPDELRTAGVDPAAIGRMVRPAVTPAEGYRLVSIDYAQIEARVIAWLAGEMRTLRAFAAGEDIYCTVASAMYGVPVTKTNENSALRALGKIAVLGCGFGAGPGGLSRANPTVPMDDLRTAVTAWRSANPKVVTMWNEMEAAVRNVAIHGGPDRRLYRVGLRGRPTICGGSGRDLLIDLPSGRQLRYHDVREEWYEKRLSDGSTKNTFGLRMTIRGARLATWGGDIVQTIVQATARDIIAENMADAVLTHGYRVVLSVHDEVVAEVKTQQEAEALAAIMGRVPVWAAGLPVSAEPILLDYYQKT